MTALKTIYFFFFLLLTACASHQPLTITESMNAALVQKEEQVVRDYPDAEINVARECRIHPAGVYFSKETNLYAITCAIPTHPGVYGLVYMDDFTVVDAFTVNVASQGLNMDTVLAEFGYKK